MKLYSEGRYSDALAFFLGLSAESPVDKIEVSYYLGLCYAKLEKYDDSLLFLEQVVTSGTQLERILQCRFLLAVIYAISGRKRLADFELNKLLLMYTLVERELIDFDNCPSSISFCISSLDKSLKSSKYLHIKHCPL